MTVPQEFIDDFNALFAAQTARENEDSFKEKRKQLDYLTLTPKQDLSTLSEVFQDPMFLSKISEESHRIMNRIERLPRVRSMQDMTTTRKPQAKDVMANRVVEDDIQVDIQEGFINPLIPKKRAYISESTHQETNPELSAGLLKKFEEISQNIQASHLKTVRSEYLYTLLPRQRDPHVYLNMKNEYTPTPSTPSKTWISQDTVLTVTFYFSGQPWKKFQEIEILGSNSLSDLRDAMYCLSDFTMRYTAEEVEDRDILDKTQRKYSKSLFYMDHVFYVDIRTFDITDYEPIILRWLKNNKVKKDFSYQTVAMHTTHLNQISLPLDTPCAFIHQDTCEHMFMFRDIRLSMNDTLQHFPRTVFAYKYTRFKCSLCTVFPAKYVTHDDLISGFSPCYFCDRCFSTFHGDDLDSAEFTWQRYYGSSRETK